MEIKRASELVLCTLLTEALPDLVFLPAKGGRDDVTPIWQSNFDYKNSDILRSTDLTKLYAIVVSAPGNSGTTMPDFDDVPGTVYDNYPQYIITSTKAVPKAIDSGVPVPPFAVIAILEGEKTMHQEGTSFLKGELKWITRADATNVVTHSLNFQRIYDAFALIGSGYDFLRRLTVHGVDITGTTDYVDEARQAHGDIIQFTMGVSEKSVI